VSPDSLGVYLEAPSQEVRRVAFSGSGGTLFGIQIVNVLLTIITLGIYYFWGKTRVRAYTHSEMEFDGDRFAYHGTGKELLVGGLKAFGLFVVIVGGLGLLQFLTPGEAPKIAIGLLIYAVGLVLVPIATVGSRKYRLSRASWRGIRFSFRGQTGEYMRIFIGGAVLTFVTLGLYYPFFYNNMWKYLIGNSYFGTKRFAFDGSGSDLFGRYLLAIVLSIFTLGLYWFWFSAERNRYYWSHTAFESARFRSTVRGGPLFRLTLGNVLLAVFTLGLAVPWVVVRNLRFVCTNVMLEGPVDFAAIQQDAQAASPVGESLADFLGLDIVGLVPS